MTGTETDSSSKPTVLVIDDEQMLCRVIERFLRSNYEVVSVTSGAAGLEQLEGRDEIAGILCDLMMPEMTGMDFYGELEAHFPEYLDRVAFLTGGTFTPEARRFISEGEHLVIEKPFRPDRLHDVLGGLIEEERH